MADRAPLHVDIQLQQGALNLAVRFETTAPWCCLFGASGGGKTTLLRTVAGFLRPDTGRVALRNRAVLVDSAQGIFVPAHQRPVRTAPQRAWLFPGTVRANVRYGVAPGTAASTIRDILERFRLEPLATTPVDSLSGGEQQRVSLARAVAAALHGERPAQLLLLDEPFAGMDTPLRDELAPTLRDWLAAHELQVLSVTHDVSEAFLLRAEVVRIAGGRLFAQGPATEVLADERERLQAALL